MGQFYDTPNKSPRQLQLEDLRHLLTFPRLGAWGMEALIDTLHKLIPDLEPEQSPVAAPSTTVDLKP